jgi:hypothetical protein
MLFATGMILSENRFPLFGMMPYSFAAVAADLAAGKHAVKVAP